MPDHPARKTVAAAAGDGNVQLFDAATGKEIGTPQSHQGKVFALAFSPDGRLLATGCGRRPDAREANPGVLHLLDAVTGKLLRRLDLNVPATCVGFGPKGGVVAAGGFAVTMWKTAELEDATILNVQLKPVGRRLSEESTVRAVFDPLDPNHLLLLNPSGALAVTHPDETVFGSGERLSPQGWVVGAGFRQDGKVFTANGDGTVRLWSRTGHKMTDLAFNLPTGDAGEVVNGVLSVAVHPDGKSVAAGTRDGYVFLYHFDRPKEPTKFACSTAPAGSRMPVGEVEFSADGRRLIAQDLSFRVFVFDVSPPGVAGPVAPLPDGTGAGRTDFVAASPDGHTVLLAGRERDWFTLADLRAHGPRRDILVPGGIGPLAEECVDEGFLLRVRAVAFSPARKRVAVADRSGRVYVFDTDTGAKLVGPIGHPTSRGSEGGCARCCSTRPGTAS